MPRSKRREKPLSEHTVRSRSLELQTLEVDLDDEVEVALMLVVVANRRVRTHDRHAVDLGTQVDMLSGGQPEYMVFGRKEELEAADVVCYVLLFTYRRFTDSKFNSK